MHCFCLFNSRVDDEKGFGNPAQDSRRPRSRIRRCGAGRNTDAGRSYRVRMEPGLKTNDDKVSGSS